MDDECEDEGADAAPGTPSTRRVGQMLCDWACKHPIQTFSATVGVLATVRLLVVSEMKPDTMAVLLQTTSLSVIGTTAAALLWTAAVAALVALPASVAGPMRLSYVAADDDPSADGDTDLGGRVSLSAAAGTKMTRRLEGPRTVLLTYVALAGLAALSVEFIDDQWALLLSAVGVGCVISVAVMLPGRGPEYVKDLERHQAGTGKFLIGLFLVIGLGLIASLAVSWAPAISAPWHQRETITFNSGPTEPFDGYVLEDAGIWMTVMRHDGREIEQIKISLVADRSPHGQ